MPEFAHIAFTIVFKLKAWDENCPQNIPQLFDNKVIDALQSRIHHLETQLTELDCA